MQVDIVEVSCPICGSNECRSKVGDENGVWWFICDSMDCPDYFVVDMKIIHTKGRRYFTRKGGYNKLYIEYTDANDNCTHLAYRKHGQWHKK